MNDTSARPGDQHALMLSHKNESDKPAGEILFLADAMLGKLAKWLRLLGHDTAYDPTWDDAAIVRRARAEGRVVLTRDRQLAKRRGLQVILLESQSLEGQMAQIVAELDLPLVEAGTRCCICNVRLEPVDKQEVAERLPPYVLETQQVFHRCPTCDRIYWPGGHWARMQPRLRRLMGEA